MKIIETVSDIDKIPKGCVLTVGNFDGIHIGHQKILTAAKKIADQKKTKLVMMTFDPHPLAVLHPEKVPGILTPLMLKKHLLVGLGVDCRLVLKSTPDILSLPPRDFVEQYLTAAIAPDVVIEGEDFSFGLNRTGNVETLKTLGSSNGFDVVIVDSQKIEIPDGQTIRVSSTMVRYMLGSGRVADAAAALGRPYRLIGEITPGRGKGKHLGFPTLNMKIPDQLIPAEAVYAGLVELGDSEDDVCIASEKVPAVFSIGQARTFGDQHPLLIEAHLLAENAAQLTGKWMAMDFVEYIRKQYKFNTENDLAKQIAEDCQKARQILTA